MKIGRILTAIMSTGAFYMVQAHMFWVDGANDEKLGKFIANMGYSDDFPKLEPIMAERVHLFAPITVISKDGSKKKLTQSGENYRYEGERLDKGTYILLAQQNPMYSLKKRSDGKWLIDKTKLDLKDLSDIQICRLMTITSKRVLNLGEIDGFVTKPIGVKIEIVPLQNPADFRVDKPFKLQVFTDGKPLKRAKLTGTFAGFLDHKHAFYGMTDEQGITEVLALRPGFWVFEVIYERLYPDATKCDKETLKTTLSFEIKE
ncbi:DUF4198 domain-containing protein [Campylobacter concisus]|uniref:DUF4198 domain-containing protein n=1 Tax=Campylobacter concisus TaxID=199 RepID=UPI00122CC75A|nr:DUF4198 domain-containing protein [Campylobacter concisus]